MTAERERPRGHVWLPTAVKFTPAGGTITLAAEAADGAVRLRVSDTGAGIRPEHVPHLFDRFCRRRGPTAAGSAWGCPS